MKYIIMADGRMSRWDCYDSKMPPKHLVKVNNETLLERLVRQLQYIGNASEIIITSHNPLYEVDGALRYEPQNNLLEIDRFTWELIEDNICFLYGDTYYTDEAINCIISQHTKELHFVGTKKSIIAVIVGDGNLMKENVNYVKKKFLEGQLSECKGWQVYRQYENIPLGQEKTGKHFTLVEDTTQGFNTKEEYNSFIERHEDYNGDFIGECKG